MRLSTSPNLGHRHGVVVTAELQQAIALLNMSNGELASYLSEVAEENPFLETDRPAPVLPPLPRGVAASGDAIDRIALFAQAQDASLYAHAAQAADAMFRNPADRKVAAAFIDALEPSGWLGEPVEAVALRTGVSAGQAAAVLEGLQRIEPAGLFAQSLAECLRLQARAEGILDENMACVLDNLPMVSAGQLPALARKAEMTLDDLRALLKRIRAMNPKPGTSFDAAEPLAQMPDVLVTADGAGWRVDLNRSNLPSVAVVEGQMPEMPKAASRREIGDHVWMRDRLTQARWIRRAVENRNITILKVSAELVRRQGAFLRDGPAHLVPLTLREVADVIGMHESTVSRVTSGVMLSTPRGTFLMKSLFSAALASEGEGSASAAAVRFRIRQLVEAEPGDAPLSDDDIASLITAEGTFLARRTVAKYRSMLRIPSSFMRRRMAFMARPTPGVAELRPA